MTFLHNLWYNMKAHQAEQRKRREDAIVQAGELFFDIVSRLTPQDLQKIQNILKLWSPNNG